MAPYTNPYAKLKRLNDLNHFGKPKYKYALEIRDIYPESSIESFVPENRFNNEAEAYAYAAGANIKIVTSWYKAEQDACVYRDGNAGLYRARDKVGMAGTDPDPQDDKAWANYLANKDQIDAEDRRKQAEENAWWQEQNKQQPKPPIKLV